jgi:hypothetical protein
MGRSEAGERNADSSADSRKAIGEEGDREDARVRRTPRIAAL